MTEDALVAKAAASARVRLRRLTSRQRSALQANAKPGRRSSKALEAMFRSQPYLIRGVTKQVGDCLKHGFRVTMPGTEDDHPVNQLVQAWWRDQFIDQRFVDGGVSGHVHGDGILEIEWSDDGEANTAPPDSAEPIDVHVVDATTVTLKLLKAEDDRMHVFAVQKVPGRRDVILHPDRFIQIRHLRMPGFLHGYSTVEAAFDAAMAKVKGTKGAGEFLFHSGQPKIYASLKNGQDDEIEEVLAMINDDDFILGYAWDDRLTIEQLNPVAYDPKPFQEALVEEMAAALGMPVALLTGVQAGSVTGSETNLTDYHSDLVQAQHHVYEPGVTRLVSGLTGLDPGDFDIVWHPFPSLPQMEAVASRDQSTAFANYVLNGVNPVKAGQLVGIDLTEDDVTPPDARGLRDALS